MVRCLLRLLAGPLLGDRHPYMTVQLAIVVAACVGGLGPALLTLVAGMGIATYLFLPPFNSPVPATLAGWIGFIVSAATGTVIVVLVEAMRIARRRAEASFRTAAAAREALAESHARTRVILDTAVTGIVAIDERGRIETFNRAAERMFGYRAGEVIGRNVSVLMPSPYREEHDRYLATYLETGVPKVIGTGREVVGRRKDGSLFPLAIAVADTRLPTGRLFTAVLRDLTLEKEAEERERQLLRQAQQRERLADIGAVTARIAHDFGNPIAGVLMSAEGIVRRIARSPSDPLSTIASSASTILETTRRLSALVCEFKDFAREQRLELRDVDLRAFLREVVEAWQPEATARGVALAVVEDEGARPVASVDPEKLRRVLDNLVKNALEALDHGPGEVTIRAAFPADGSVRLTVEDTGPGVPASIDAFALFETTKSNGTGLGLPICRQIVRAHGGGITLATRDPRGTVVHVELPRRSAL